MKQKAPPHDNDFIDRMLEFGQLVTRDKDRPAAIRFGSDKLSQPADAFRIEPIRGLVKDEDLRVPGQCRGEPEALTHPGRIPAYGSPAAVGKADSFEKFVDPLEGHTNREADDRKVATPRYSVLESETIKVHPDNSRWIT